MTGQLRYFNTAQKKLVGDLLETAECLVAESYRMGESDWGRMRFDVLTAEGLEGEERRDGVLAQVLRYDITPHSRGTRAAVRTVYRICLQDPVILDVLVRNPALSFSPLLLYVLVHELVHVVRFSCFLQRYDVSVAEREAEERRVDCRVKRILEGGHQGGMAEVFTVFSPDAFGGRLKVL